MNAVAHEGFSDRLPSDVEIRNADSLRKILAASLNESGHTVVDLVVSDGQPATTVTLTPAIAQTFLEVLRLVASGQGFRMIPVGADLTTQEAADLLNVSRPFLVELLESGKIKFHKVGRHRRVKAEDLFAYKSQRDQQRSDALEEMAAEDAEAGLI